MAALVAGKLILPDGPVDGSNRQPTKSVTGSHNVDIATAGNILQADGAGGLDFVAPLSVADLEAFFLRLDCVNDPLINTLETQALVSTADDTYDLGTQPIRYGALWNTTLKTVKTVTGTNENVTIAANSNAVGCFLNAVNATSIATLNISPAGASRADAIGVPIVTGDIAGQSCVLNMTGTGGKNFGAVIGANSVSPIAITTTIAGTDNNNFGANAPIGGIGTTLLMDGTRGTNFGSILGPGNMTISGDADFNIGAVFQGLLTQTGDQCFNSGDVILNGTILQDGNHTTNLGLANGGFITLTGDNTFNTAPAQDTFTVITLIGEGCSNFGHAELAGSVVLSGAHTFNAGRSINGAITSTIAAVDSFNSGPVTDFGILNLEAANVSNFASVRTSSTLTLSGADSSNFGAVSVGANATISGVNNANLASISEGTLIIAGAEFLNLGSMSGALSSINIDAAVVGGANFGFTSNGGLLDINGIVLNFGSVDGAGSEIDFALGTVLNFNTGSVVGGSQILFTGSSNVNFAPVLNSGTLTLAGNSNKVFLAVDAHTLDVQGSDNILSGRLAGTGTTTVDAGSDSNIGILKTVDTTSIDVLDSRSNLLKISNNGGGLFSCGGATNAIISHSKLGDASTATYDGFGAEGSTYFSQVFQSQDFSSFAGGGVCSFTNAIINGGTTSSITNKGWANMLVAQVGNSHSIDMGTGALATGNMLLGNFASPSPAFGSAINNMLGIGNIAVCAFNTSIGYGNLDVQQQSHLGGGVLNRTLSNLIVTAGIFETFTLNKNICTIESRGSAVIGLMAEQDITMSCDGSMFLGVAIGQDVLITGDNSFQLGTGNLPYDDVFQAGITGLGIAVKGTVGAYAPQAHGQIWNDGTSGVKVRTSNDAGTVNTVDFILRQRATTGTVNTVAAGGSANWNEDSTTDGGAGGNAYTIADVVLAMKQNNWLA